MAATKPNSKNVTVGKPKKAGAIFFAPAGSTLPTDATTALDAAFVQLGYASEDGLTNANSPESDSIAAWGGDVVYSYQTSKEDSFSVTLIEALNEDVLKAVYGASNVSGTLATGLTVTANNSEAETACWVFDLIFRGNAAKRIVIPNGKISELGEISYVDGKPVGYPITITAMADGDGNTHYEYVQSAGA